MDSVCRLDEPLLQIPDTPPAQSQDMLRCFRAAAGAEPAALSQVFAKLAIACGGRLLAEVNRPESHAVFDVTLEHALRLYEAWVEDERGVNSRDKGSRSTSFDDTPKFWRRMASFDQKRVDDVGDVMDMTAFKNALESEGFQNLDTEPLFGVLWSSLAQETLDVRTFHRVLRLLKLHLLCGALPERTSLGVPSPLEPEQGFVGIMDWNPRVVKENYFNKADSSAIFLSHRHPSMKMRWVHCSAVSKATILRLAVKYQLHPLPVEDTIQLQKQSVPLVRSYSDNFFVVLPLLRLTTPARNALAKLQESGEQPDIVARQTTNPETEAVDDSAPAFDVEIEQGRVALFVAGAPRFDTVISIQTNWVVHHCEDGSNHYASYADSPRPERRFCRRRRRQLRSRVLLRSDTEEGGELARSYTEESPEPSPRLDYDLEETETDPSAYDDDACQAFDGIAEEIQKDCSMLRSGNSAWLLWRVVDVLVDDMEPILSAFRARLMWFGAHIAKRRAKAENGVEKKLLWTRVELEWVQRKVRPMIRVVRHLIHDKTIEADVTQYLEDVEDHLETYVEEISRSIGVCDSLRDQVRSFRDREQQGVLYVLALVTTMTTPMQILASMYGMNFFDDKDRPVVPGLGRLDKQRGYTLFWGLGIMIMLSIYISFRFVLKWM